MQEKLYKKLILPIALFSAIGLTGAVYVITHTGSMTAQAASTSAVTPTDKETQDDTVSPSPKQTTTDSNESEQTGKAGGNDGENNN